MAKRINAMEAKFIAFLQADPEENATQAAIKAGYSEKSASQIAYQLMRKPKIIAELSAWKDSKRKELSKDDYVDLALNDYKSLDVEHANKPRFLDLAGKALGYIGANNQPQVVNNTLNITQNIKEMSKEQLIEYNKRMIESM